MAEENVALVQKAYAAFLEGDIPAVLATLSEDVDWHVPKPLPHARDAHGRDEVGAFFQGLADTWADFSVDVEGIVASDDRVVVIGRAEGKLDGTEAGYDFVHSWTVRDGALARMDEYVAPDETLLSG